MHVSINKLITICPLPSWFCHSTLFCIVFLFNSHQGLHSKYIIKHKSNVSAKMISPLCSNALKRSQRGKSTDIHKLRDNETIEMAEISNPQSCFTSPHLICLAHLRAFSCRTTVFCVTAMSPMGYFLFCFCSILLLKSFVKGNVSPTYFDDVLSKSEQKRSLKAKEEEWRSEHSTSSGWIGGGGDQGQWKTEEGESSKGLVMVSRCTDSKG